MIITNAWIEQERKKRIASVNFSDISYYIGGCEGEVLLKGLCDNEYVTISEFKSIELGNVNSTFYGNISIESWSKNYINVLCGEYPVLKNWWVFLQKNGNLSFVGNLIYPDGRTILNQKIEIRDIDFDNGIIYSVKDEEIILEYRNISYYQRDCVYKSAHLKDYMRNNFTFELLMYIAIEWRNM